MLILVSERNVRNMESPNKISVHHALSIIPMASKMVEAD